MASVYGLSYRLALILCRWPRCWCRLESDASLAKSGPSELAFPGSIARKNVRDSALVIGFCNLTSLLQPFFHAATPTTFAPSQFAGIAPGRSYSARSRGIGDHGSCLAQGPSPINSPALASAKKLECRIPTSVVAEASVSCGGCGRRNRRLSKLLDMPRRDGEGAASGAWPRKLLSSRACAKLVNVCREISATGGIASLVDHEACLTQAKP